MLFDRLRHGLCLDGHRALALLPGSLVGIAPFLCRGLCGERMDITSKRTLPPAYGLVALPGMLRRHLWLRPIPERGTRHFLGALCGWICQYCAFDDPLPDVEVLVAPLRFVFSFAGELGQYLLTYLAIALLMRYVVIPLSIRFFPYFTAQKELIRSRN